MDKTKVKKKSLRQKLSAKLSGKSSKSEKYNEEDFEYSTKYKKVSFIHNTIFIRPDTFDKKKNRVLIFATIVRTIY